MVIISVIELLILERIELNSEDMVIGAAIIGEIEKPQMLSRAGAVDSSKGCEEKSKSMAREKIWLRGNRENEGSCKGK